jgi:isoleucyl-tRNA synthetase
LWKELSSAFWKDTWRIISAAKRGDVLELDNGSIQVSDNGDEWVLEPQQYEIRYSGLQWDNQVVEEWVIVDLDLTITPELKAEWIAREISRFLNQLRKEADYQVSDRVACYWNTSSEELTKVVTVFAEFLTWEALLSKIESAEQSGDITQEFTHEDATVSFTLKR